MVTGPSGAPTQMSFILRFWLEDGDPSRGFWRGRVKHVGGVSEAYVQNGEALLRFIEGKLLEGSGVALPLDGPGRTRQ